MKLKNRVALVTGGGSGIGKAIAQRFAAEGARVIIAGRSRKKLDDAVAELRSQLNVADAIEVDVSNSLSVRQMFEELVQKVDRLDILVNNAGIGIEDLEHFNRTAEARGKEFSATHNIETQWNVTRDMNDEVWRTMLAVHLDGTFFCTREALKRMGGERGGAIVNISSTAGLTGQEGAPHYSAAKAGILGFTRALAREVASQNIRVNAITPGFVETAMSEGYSTGFKRGTLGRIPLGRWGTADEVAAVALFLASDDGSYLTGQCISPNGGIFIS